MNHFLLFKWFYLTLGFWCLLSTFSGWALIYSPFHLNPKPLSEFAVQVNGMTARNRLRFLSGSVRDSLDSITDDWKNEGWVCSTGSLNLAPILLNAPADFTDSLSSLAQLRIFKRKGELRLLGLLAVPAEGKTFLWTVEINQATALSFKPTEIVFPLVPPTEAVNVFWVKSARAEFLSWSMPGRKASTKYFENHCASQGFIERLLSHQTGEDLFLIQKGSTKLTAIAQNDKNNYAVFLTH